MDNLIYKERRLSKTEEMFHIVFSSKAVLAILILSCIVCVSNIIFTFMFGFVANDLILDKLDKYIALMPEVDDPVETLENTYIAITNMVFVFIAFAVVYFWIALGTLFIYIRAKNFDQQKSVRTGFTIIQAFGITKIIFEGIQSFLFMFVGFVLLQQAETFVAGIITLLIIAVNLMYTISIVVFCSSVKKTADGMIPSSSGASTLQFSSFLTGIVQGIASVLVMILLFIPVGSDGTIPAETVSLIENIEGYCMIFTAVWIMSVVIHFLVFAVVKNYARKLPLAANADRVYQNNMANLYPQQVYQSPYQSNGNYQAYQPNQDYQAYQPNQNYVPFQPPEDHNGYLPYDPKNDVDNHSRIDDTPYPPYDPTQKYN